MEQSRVVGIKQVKKALREGRALEVILADDADPALTEPLEAACREAGVNGALVNYHFGTKENLYGACMRRMFESPPPESSPSSRP